MRSARNRKPPPDGFDDIEDTLLEFQNKLKDAENAPHDGKKRYETVWPIFQITHQRSRYIYDLYYEKEAISKQLYDWLLKNGYADANLIAKWKKQGYEKVCSILYVLQYDETFTNNFPALLPTLHSNRRNQL
jgi:bud site selection protein 31